MIRRVGSGWVGRRLEGTSIGRVGRDAGWKGVCLEGTSVGREFDWKGRRLEGTPVGRDFDWKGRKGRRLEGTWVLMIVSSDVVIAVVVDCSDRCSCC